MTHCGECPFFKWEDTDGYGICDISGFAKNCSKEGDIVYDPFMGSGTTALACVRLGRHYIGSEISEKYVSMANEKIRIEESQLKLF